MKRILRLGRRAIHLALRALLATFALDSPSGATAQDVNWFITSSGARVATPNIKALTCEQMLATLDAIDATGYRGVAPTPSSQEDMPLYDYETELSIEFYWSCTARVVPGGSDNIFDDGLGAFN